MMGYGGVDVMPYAILISDLAEYELSASSPGLIIFWEKCPDARWRGDWVVSKAGVVAKKLRCPCWESNPSHLRAGVH
jgi:hypothetical protein